MKTFVVCVLLRHEVNKAQPVTLHYKFSPDKFIPMGKETSQQLKTSKRFARSRKSSGAREKKTASAKRGRPWSNKKCILLLLGITLLLTIFISLQLYLFVLLNIPNLKSIKDYQPKMATLLLDRNNKVVKRIFEENRRVVSLESMPSLLPKAFVAAEDSRFYQHPGVDILVHVIKRPIFGMNVSNSSV